MLNLQSSLSSSKNAIVNEHVFIVVVFVFPKLSNYWREEGERAEDWLPTYKHQTVADIFRGGG